MFGFGEKKDLMKVVDELRADFIKTHGSLLNNDEAVKLTEKIKAELREDGKLCD